MPQTQPRSVSVKAFPNGPAIFSGVLACTLLMAFMFPRSLGYLPVGLGLLSATLLLCKEKRIFSKDLKPVYICTGIVLLALASCFWSIDFQESMERVKKMAPLLIFGSVLLYSFSRLDIGWTKPFVAFLPYILIFALAWNVSELITNGFLHKALNGMAMDDASYTPAAHNRSILLCLIFTPLAFYALRYVQMSTIQRQVLGMLIVGLILAILAMTESQTAHLATAIAVLGFVALRPKNRIIRYGLMLIIVGLIFSAPFLAEYLFKVLPEMIIKIEWFREGYAPERLEIWDFVSRYALQNPLYGFGIEATRSVPAFDTQMIYRPVATVLHPHNFAIQLWIEFGVIGVLGGSALICFVISLLPKLQTDLGRYTVASLFVILTLLSTAYGIWQGWLIGAILLVTACIIILNRLHLENKSS